MGGKSSQMAKNGQQPQSQMPMSGQSPQSQMPMSWQPPQSQMPMSGQPPQSQMPMSGQSPQSQMPMGGQPPQSQMPMGGQPPQSQTPLGGPQYQMGMPMTGQQNQMAAMAMLMGGNMGAMALAMAMGGQQNQMGMEMPPNPVPLPDAIPGIPPGLEYLNVIDTVFVRQHIEVLEVVAGRHMPNTYDLMNLHGELFFRAIEVTDPLSTIYLGSDRNFRIIIYDLWSRQVMSLSRPWSGCIEEALKVCAPPGNLVGIVDPQTCCSPEYLVRDATGQPALRIQGLGANCCTLGNVDFKVWTMAGTQVGTITKQFSGIVQELHTAATNFVITFPKDLNICAKATLVGACVLLDFIHFEKTDGEKQ